MAASTIAAPSSPRRSTGCWPPCRPTSQRTEHLHHLGIGASPLADEVDWCVAVCRRPAGTPAVQHENCSVLSVEITHRGCNGPYDPLSVEVHRRVPGSHDDRRSPMYVTPPQYPGHRGRRTVCHASSTDIVGHRHRCTRPRGSASPAIWHVREQAREDDEEAVLAPGATRASGAGNRAVSPRSPIGSAPASSATSTASTTRSRSGASPASARCSSPPTTTTCAPASLTPSRSPRWR